MDEHIPESIHRETPMELFKREVELAIRRQDLDLSESSTWYLVQLLDSFVRPDRLYSRAGVPPDRSLAELFCQGLACEGRRKFLLLKLTGDLALFASGFLAESLHRSLVGADYYQALGGHAYGALRDERHGAGELFAELSANFVLFADVLCEVGARCALCDDHDLLRLYSSWAETGSPRSARLLRERGILVVPSSQTIH